MPRYTFVHYLPSWQLDYFQLYLRGFKGFSH